MSTELKWQLIDAEKPGTTLEIGKQVDGKQVVQNMTEEADKYAVLHLAPDETAKTVFVMAKSTHTILHSIYDFSVIDVASHVNMMSQSIVLKASFFKKGISPEIS